MTARVSKGLANIALLAMALYGEGALAVDPATPTFSFRGFGTVGLVHSSEDQADFTSSILKPNGAGHSHNWSADVDSLIAGQVSATFTPKLSAVLQVIAEQDDDNTYRPHLEWANVQYQFTPDFNVRFGRTVLPTFLFSGTRKVGYTYPWVRPPLEVYRVVPVTASDGVDANFRMHAGEFTHSIQANYGSSEPTLPGNGGTIEASDAWGITYTGEYHAVTVHLAYQRPLLTVDSADPIFDAFRQFGPQGIALADKYDVDREAFPIIAAGVTYDPGKWFATAEWSHTDSRSFLGKSTGWYVSVGRRLGRFTPYLTYAEADADNLSDPGLNLSTLPPSLVGTAAGLNAALNALLGQKVIQSTISAGGRWELTRSVAFKLQFDHTRIGAGSPGVLTNLQPDFRPGGEVDVISATIDFVF
jgi:hypothetical protein